MPNNQPQEKLDEGYMAMALEVAQEGLGWTSPNPLVGCILVRDGVVIGQGAHLRDGEGHAEALALAGTRDAKGATAYVTLEPCTHQGRQPSCCQALINAGVSRVVYGIEDLDIRTAGAARPILEEAGVEVTKGVMAAECGRFLDYYLHAKQLKSVFVHLKLALSLDAKLACKTGHSQWLSGPISLGYAHYLRQKYDAVLVGAGTVLADNPRLTTRGKTMEPYFRLPENTPERNPVRAIIDPTFSLLDNPELEIHQVAGDNFRKELPRLIFVGDMQHRSPEDSASGSGSVIQLGLQKNSTGRLEISELLEGLWDKGIRSLLVEGGSKVAQEFIQQGQVDKVSLVYTPKIIGGDGMGFSPNLGLKTVGEAINLKLAVAETLGTDVVVSGYF